MHLNGLDLNLLIALDALLSERNVTRAAERTSISQPGMSAALQKLRWHFADQLLERVGRKLELTPRARTLAAPVKDILSEIQALSTNVGQFDPGTAQRVFRVAASTYCGDLIAVPILRRIAAAAPNIGCQFDDLQLETVSRLAEGRIDFAITIMHRLRSDIAFDEDQITTTSLFTDTMVLIVAQDNETVGDGVTFEQVCELPYAETRFGNDLVSIGERVWRQRSKAPRVRAWLPNFQLTLAAVSRSDMVAIVPSRLVRLYADRYRLRALRPPVDVPEVEERLFWHSRNDGDPGHRWFRNLIKSVVYEEGLASASG